MPAHSIAALAKPFKQTQVVQVNSDGTGPRGRGAGLNPVNRFETLHLEREEDWDPSEDPALATQFYKDQSKTIINYNDSPDIGFEASINAYRGCEHGCIYCYARPFHEYLGFSAGLDFESRIMVKTNAPQLLRRELSMPKWRPQVIAMSGVTDCYQPVERRLNLTRGCLEVLAEFKNPVVIVTKNHLVTRDADLLSRLAAFKAAAVYVSVTTLDPTLAAAMEPRTSMPSMRLKAIEVLHQAHVPVGVLVAPVIPGLTDHEIPSILKAAAAAGATSAGYVPLRLPFGVGTLFEDWLSRHYPERKEKVLNAQRQLRDGRLNDPRYGTRMRGEGPLADRLDRWFGVGRRRAGLDREMPALSVASFCVPLSERPHTQSIFPFLETSFTEPGQGPSVP